MVLESSLTFPNGLQWSRINLVDHDNVISDDKNLSKQFSNFFDMGVKNLDIKGPQVSHVNEDSDPIDIALKKYVDHPNILKVKEYFKKPTEFNFLGKIPNDMTKEIKH